MHSKCLLLQVQKSLSELPDEEADLSRAETVLRTLGVKSEERLAALVNYFFRVSPTINYPLIRTQPKFRINLSASEESYSLRDVNDNEPTYTFEDVLIHCSTQSNANVIFQEPEPFLEEHEDNEEVRG